MKTKKSIFTTASVLLLLLILTSCSERTPSDAVDGGKIIISPDYSEVTFPPNIAPANFMIKEKASAFLVNIHAVKGEGIILHPAEGKVIIPPRKWKDILEKCKGGSIFTDIYSKKDGKWIKYNTISNYVAEDPIDKYLVYRLIEPGYETWNRMGIYQRNLESFSEKPVMLNTISDGNCMNCHSFCQNNSSTMMFHMRAAHAGTVIFRNNKIEKVNTKTARTISPGVYPAWHPGGKFIAFSVNNIVQMFHSTPGRLIDVIDTLSDVVIYDVEARKISTCSSLSTKDNLETFPAWSPDGRFLYYCSAKSIALKDYDKIRYDLLRISFDPQTKAFGTVDTVVRASANNLSVSFPRISPDGKYVLFCQSAYGNFSIWHPESDLYLKNLVSGEITKPDINSDQTESYHTWSSTGRWIVFSSRRIDGLFTRPYFAYFDKSGKACKPFILPQKDPSFYFSFNKSYNVPELVTSAIMPGPRDFAKIEDKEVLNAVFDDSVK